MYLENTSIKKVLFTNTKLAYHIKEKNYDLIHFINLSESFWPIVKLNRSSCKFIFSLHEANSKRATKGTESWIKQHYKKLQNHRAHKALRYSSLNTFFSKNEKENFEEIHPNSKIALQVIKFGLFDTFLCFKPKRPKGIAPQKKNYYLYLGYIRPYKGVDILLEVINNKFNEDEFIIAGKDEMGLSTKYSQTNITFLNRFLNDNELVYLVKNAKAIILPYQNASQSGLPNVAFAFTIPVLFSNIKGLNEYLYHDYNGVAFNVNNQIELTNAIEKLQDDNYLLTLKSNIIKSPFNKENLSWDKIAKDFIDTYKKASK
jgi:glycosyltransferase involved in cell wall biosynthesis